jgi:hypothetical protein
VVFVPGNATAVQLPVHTVHVVDIASGTVTTLSRKVAGDINPVSWLPSGNALLVNLVHFSEGAS